MKMLPPAGMSLTLRNTLEFPSYQESPCIYDAKDALYREPKVGNADARNPFRSGSDSLGGCGCYFEKSNKGIVKRYVAMAGTAVCVLNWKIV